MRNNILAKLTVGIFVLLAIALVVVLVGAVEAERMPEMENNFAGRAIENGADVFAVNCIGCHGVQGQGIPGVGPALNSSEFFTTRLQEVGYAGSLRSYIESTVNAGRPVGSGQYAAKMPTWGQEYGGPLRPDQVSDVTAFILNWEGAALATAPITPTEGVTGTAPVVSGDPIEVGQAAYAKYGCAGCHGEPGGAGVIGPNLGGLATRAGTMVPGQSAEDYIHTSIVKPNDFIVPQCPTGPCPSGLMPANFEQQMSPEELDGMVQYLLTLE